MLAGGKKFHLSRDVIPSKDENLFLHREESLEGESLEGAFCSARPTSGFDHVHPPKEISHNGPDSKQSTRTGAFSKGDTS